MSLISIFAAGLVASTLAKLLLPRQSSGGLFILGVGGAIIASVVQYSVRQPVGFFGPLVGAAVLLAIYAATIRNDVVKETNRRDDLRKAA